MPFEEGDFIKIDYVARVQDTNEIFDTTKKEAADNEGVEYDESAEFKPMVVCLGQGQILDGLDEKLQGKDEGSYTIELTPEEAFGKKKSDLLELIPKKEFDKKDVDPIPGMELNIDGRRGKIKTVSGGRVIVDFNHPLASKHLRYEVDILGEAENNEEKVNSFLENFGIPTKSVEVDDDQAVIEFQQALPPQLTEELKEKIESNIDIEVTFLPEPDTQDEPTEDEGAEEAKE